MLEKGVKGLRENWHEHMINLPQCEFCTSDNTKVNTMFTPTKQPSFYGPHYEVICVLGPANT